MLYSILYWLSLYLLHNNFYMELGLNDSNYCYTGIIGQHYRVGEIITVKAKITANHKGYLTFKICPVNNPNTKVTQSCLDK